MDGAAEWRISNVPKAPGFTPRRATTACYAHPRRSALPALPAQVPVPAGPVCVRACSHAYTHIPMRTRMFPCVHHSRLPVAGRLMALQFYANTQQSRCQHGTMPPSDCPRLAAGSAACWPYRITPLTAVTMLPGQWCDRPFASARSPPKIHARTPARWHHKSEESLCVYAQFPAYTQKRNHPHYVVRTHTRPGFAPRTVPGPVPDAFRVRFSWRSLCE